MKCPNCGAEAAAGASECVRCGAIFAKILAQRAREKEEAAREAAEFLARSMAPSAPAAAFRHGRKVAIAVIVLWIGGLFWYYVDALNEREERIESDMRARSRAAGTRSSPP